MLGLAAALTLPACGSDDPAGLGDEDGGNVSFPTVPGVWAYRSFTASGSSWTCEEGEYLIRVRQSTLSIFGELFSGGTICRNTSGAGISDQFPVPPGFTEPLALEGSVSTNDSVRFTIGVGKDDVAWESRGVVRGDTMEGRFLLTVALDPVLGPNISVSGTWSATRVPE